MNRGDMRQLVRYRARDKQSKEWSNAQIDFELNLSALQVLTDLSNYQQINLARGTEDFSTTSGTYAYTLSASDCLRIKRMYQVGDSRERDIPCYAISEDDRFGNRFSPQEDYAWPYYVTRSHSGDDWIINFIRDPGGSYTFRVEYVVVTSTLTVDSTGSDSSSYTQIPPEFHELVPQRTVMNLIGPNGDGYPHAVQSYQTLFATMIETISTISPGPKRIRKW